jgi:hypothetical protein
VMPTPEVVWPGPEVVWPGSMPADMGDSAALRMLLEHLGSYLRFLPGPETGQRQADWIVPLLLGLKDHPDLALVKDGDWSDYDHATRFRVKKGHEFRSEFINVGIADYFKKFLPLYTAMRDDFNLPDDMLLQIGVKGIFDFAFFTFGPLGVLPSQQQRHMMPFLEATTREIQEVCDASPYPVLCQFEVPAAGILYNTVPALMRPLFTSWLAQSTIKMIKCCVPPGARRGAHLCNGDLGHKAKAHPASAAAYTRLANRIAKGRQLQYVHIPLAAGDVPPTLNEAFYRPLQNLRLPADTQVVAGFLHEGISIPEARTILGIVNKYVDLARKATSDATSPPVAVAPSCGCGRRTKEATLAVLQQGAALCARPPRRRPSPTPRTPAEVAVAPAEVAVAPAEVAPAEVATKAEVATAEVAPTDGATT